MSSKVIEIPEQTSLLLLLNDGDHLRVLAGKLAFRTAPQWLGERMVALDSVYGIGSVHVAEQRGYVSLAALDSACAVELTQAHSQSVRPSLFRRLAGVFARGSTHVALK